jgi:hypothetical protein
MLDALGQLIKISVEHASSREDIRAIAELVHAYTGLLGQLRLAKSARISPTSPRVGG